jgi:hypothetical protein
MGLDVEVGWPGATAIAAATHSEVHSDPGFCPQKFSLTPFWSLTPFFQTPFF